MVTNAGVSSFIILSSICILYVAFYCDWLHYVGRLLSTSKSAYARILVLVRSKVIVMVQNGHYSCTCNNASRFILNSFPLSSNSIPVSVLLCSAFMTPRLAGFSATNVHVTIFVAHRIVCHCNQYLRGTRYLYRRVVNFVAKPLQRTVLYMFRAVFGPTPRGRVLLRLLGGGLPRSERMIGRRRIRSNTQTKL